MGKSDPYDLWNQFAPRHRRRIDRQRPIRRPGRLRTWAARCSGITTTTHSAFRLCLSTGIHRERQSLVQECENEDNSARGFHERERVR